MTALSHPGKGAVLRRFIILVATLVAGTATAALGLWQLDRARQKQAIASAIESRAAMPPLQAQDLSFERPQDQHYRLAQVTGRWRPETLVHLENRPMDGQAGFIAVTALELDDGRAVLVQRGWQPRDLRERTRVQPVPTSRDDPVRIHARVAPPPSRLLEFEGAGQGTLRQNIDPKAYADEFGLDLLPVSLLQLEPALRCPAAAQTGCTGSVEDGLRRNWPAVASTASKNRGYAAQWFALSALVFGLYFWFQWIAPRRGRA